MWVVPAKLILMAMCNSERNVPSFIYIEIIIDVYSHIMETCRDQQKLMQTLCLFWYRRKVHLSSTSPEFLILTVPKARVLSRVVHMGRNCWYLPAVKSQSPAVCPHVWWWSQTTQAPSQKPGKARILSYRIPSVGLATDWTFCGFFCGFCMCLLDEKRPPVTFPTVCEKPKFSCWC